MSEFEAERGWRIATRISSNSFGRSSCRRRFRRSGGAQVVIPYGDFGDGFEKYLVAFITLVLLNFAMWRFFRNRSSLRARFDRASFQ
ncbi:MAG: hypothetical protein WBY67_14445 [Pseudolabrys sp.]|jgi:CO/xanthine dehydrogenase Mo-binding subunit